MQLRFWCVGGLLLSTAIVDWRVEAVRVVKGVEMIVHRR